MLKTPISIQDPKQSFLVRAPAGSGKTTCLIERLMALIASGQDPRTIWMITFTNKAVHEMKERVQIYFSDQYRHDAPPHLHPLIAKAQQVIRTHKQNLNDVIEQIQIQTIDALAQSIIQLDPTHGSYSTQIHPDPDVLYHQACDRLFVNLSITATEQDQALKHLTLELDNQVAKTQKHLMKLLASRDQWLPKICSANHDQENQTLDHLKIFWQITMETLTTSLNQPAHQVLWPIFNFVNPKINLINQATTIDDAMIDLLKSIAGLLLTSQGDVRKRLTVSQGLPPASSEKDINKKQLITDLHQAFQTWRLDDGDHQNQLIHCLQTVAYAPNLSTYQNNLTLTHWMSHILPMAVAHLQVSFQEHQSYDFIECTQLAIDRLNDPHSHTSCFYELHLKHLLVDEFQDTSNTHYQLIHSLTKHFSFTPDCSVFLVGDPMQSIYRFRQADVRLFLQLEHKKQFHLPLNIHYLDCNYRATKDLVHWTNHFFTSIGHTPFDDLGAVPFHPSTSRPKSHGSLPSLFTVSETNDRFEVIAQQVKAYKSGNSSANIGILVRKRKQVMQIQNALHILGIDTSSPMPYQFREIEDVCIVHHLVGTLLNPYDANHISAWFTSKWFQIPIQYLTTSLKQQLHVTQVILTVLKHTNQRAMQDHLRCILAPLQIALHDIKMNSLTETLMNLLCVIHPAYAADPAINAYIQCWQANQEHPPIAFDQILNQTYLPAPPSQNLPEVMTIHQAKGLEFDHVILPYIESSSSQSASNLLLWHDFYHKSQSHALFAINSQRHDSPDWMKWLTFMEKQKNQFENLRVHYVAMTRAKRTLDLILYTTQDQDPYQAKVDSQSFMDYIQRFQLPTQPGTYISNPNTKEIRSLTPPIVIGPPNNLTMVTFKQHSVRRTDCFSEQSFETWFGLAAHYCLELLVYCRNQHLSINEVIKNAGQWLQKHGCQVGKSVTGTLKPLICQALQTRELQWILANHSAEQTEWQIFQQSDQEPTLSIIDRAFLDPLGAFWIIDYKTSKNLTDDLETKFLNQLKSYHQLVSQLYPNTQVFLAIYHLGQQTFTVYDTGGQRFEIADYQKHMIFPNEHSAN